MRLRVNLPWRVLALMTGGMALVLGLSAYLNDLITRQLIEEDHYSSALGQTVAIAERIASQQLLGKPDDLQRDIALVVESRPEFKQIDVYRSAPNGAWTLAASTNPTATRLPRLDEGTRDNDLREMERPADVPGLVTMEVPRAGSIYWLISMASPPHGTSTSYVSTMVLKNSRNHIARP